MVDPTLWWSSSAYSNWTCEGVPTHGGVFFVVFSDEVTAVATSFLVGGTVFALYGVVVGTIATYIRGFFFNPIYNIPYSEIPYPELLLEVCEGIQIMRVSGYEGHRRDEVLTYRFLLEVVRSSFLLSRLTNAPEKKKKE